MSKKILIIDDEECDIKGMAIALKREGYNQISYTDTGKGGVEIAKSLKPDIILIDVVLKDIDGFDVCKQIKAIKDIKPKVIMITGHIDAVNSKKARTSRADEIIEKIVGFRNIGQTIKNLTGR